MASLEPGTRAPEVDLPLLAGGTFHLHQALQQGPVLLAFFKISCPVCQFTFPYLERIHQAYPGSKAKIIGVSQDDAKGTTAFAREYGLHFPIALDDTRRYPVSNAYGLTNVPSLFLIGVDGMIELTSVGWSRADFQQISSAVAKVEGKPLATLFRKSESVPDFKAG